VKLWILRPIQEHSSQNWSPWFDKAFGFVVRAESESEARTFADAEGGDENGKDWAKHEVMNPWLNPATSTCIELVLEGEAGVIMKDFASA